MVMPSWCCFPNLSKGRNTIGCTVRHGRSKSKGAVSRQCEVVASTVLKYDATHQAGDIATDGKGGHASHRNVGHTAPGDRTATKTDRTDLASRLSKNRNAIGPTVRHGRSESKGAVGHQRKIIPSTVLEHHTTCKACDVTTDGEGSIGTGIGVGAGVRVAASGENESAKQDENAKSKILSM